MSINKAGKSGPGQEGLSFANLLRDCLGSGVILVDAKQQIAAWAGAAETMLGARAGQMLHRSLAVLPAPLRQIARETLASGKPAADRVIALNVEGRGTLTVRLSAVPVAAGRKGSGALVLVNDLTAARRLEEHLQQLDRLAGIGTLAASMAHEIKNALVAGKTFIELLLEKHQEEDLVGIVRREMRRIDAIVSQMLRFAGPAKPAFAAIRLHDILEQSLRLVQPQLEGKLIGLNRLFRAAPDLVHGDDYQLQQAFVNLLLNALEAMGPNGTLSVGTETVGGGARRDRGREPAELAQLRVTIRDTGIGISPENMRHLFEPFFTTKQNGTGLGLPITRRIIQEHRGAITVDSQPGQGTTFQILLPALAEVR